MRERTESCEASRVSAVEFKLIMACALNGDSAGQENCGINHRSFRIPIRGVRSVNTANSECQGVAKAT